MRIDEKEAQEFQELTQKAAHLAAQTAEDRKAEDVMIYYLGNKSAVADYHVICTGFSEPHIKAVANHIGKALKEQLGLMPKGTEGKAESQWILMDYPNVLVHIFHPEGRQKYRMEELLEQGKLIYPETKDSEESE